MKLRVMGISDFGYSSLSADDLNMLNDQIFCEVEKTENDLVVMPDGSETHIDFLVTQKIKE